MEPFWGWLRPWRELCSPTSGEVGLLRIFHTWSGWKLLCKAGTTLQPYNHMQLMSYLMKDSPSQNLADQPNCMIRLLVKVL